MFPGLLILKAFFAPRRIMNFLGNVAGFVIKHWKECLFAGMALTIFYQNFMDTELLKWVGVRTIPGIEQDLIVVRSQLNECEVSRKALKSQIESTNAQIDQWANVSGQLQQSHDALVEEINKMKQQSQQAVDEILSEPTPETGEAAIQFLRDAARGDLR